MFRLWFALYAPGGETSASSHGLFAETLAREEIEATFTVEPARGPGVLFFTRFDSTLLDLVRTASRDGKDRVIAVALSKQDLSDERWTWRLLEAGASDVTTWTNPAGAACHIAARFRRWSVVDEIVDSPLIKDNLVGRSREWIATLRAIVEAARFTDAPVLILGESGTGKELAARVVHTLDPRPEKGELVVLDCTTIVPELSGSEFFGHERGAFTGAAGPRDGAFALADRGTLFLDEVGELPLKLQSQLLRVVQEHTFKRVGGNSWQRTEFRLVCATNRDLADEVANGGFRRDLYYRLASTVIRLPPLSERQEDIMPLVRHFMRNFDVDGHAPELDAELREFLLHREYPGNVRDLKQAVGRVMHRHAGVGLVTVADLPQEERPCHHALRDWRDGLFESAVRRAVTLGAHLKDIGKAAEEIAVRVAVNDEDGNLQRAAERLGVTDRALQLRRSARRLAD